MSQFDQRMLADPAISAKYKNLSSARAAFDEGSTLANDGLRRVGSGTLERFARTTQIVLQKADDRTCAQYFLSTATPQLPQTLEKLTDAQLNEYLDVRYTLMAAAAHGDATAVPLTTSQANAGASLVRTDLGEADTALLGQLSTGQHPDSEVCRIARKLFASTLRLPPNDQALALRFLFQT